jgi:hypothetical protein
MQIVIAYNTNNTAHEDVYSLDELELATDRMALLVRNQVRFNVYYI